MTYSGILVGLVAFLLIGVFHPIVIKGEYHFGKKICPVFLIVGIVALIGSLFIESVEISSSVAVFGFTCLWSIKEVFEQVKRVEKGWYPKKTDRK